MAESTQLPPVVLDQSCSALASAVARFAPVLIFTRQGEFVMSPRIAAEQMRDFFEASGISAPPLLVGASYAAFAQLIFAQQWPQRVGGLLLIDPSHRLQGEVALRRLAANDVESTDEVEAFRSFLRGFGPGWEMGCREVSTVRDLGSIPLRVLEADALTMPKSLNADVRRDLIRDRHRLLAEYAAMSRKGSVRVVEGAGHDITRDRPDAVIEHIRAMLAEIQESILR